MVDTSFNEKETPKRDFLHNTSGGRLFIETNHLICCQSQPIGFYMIETLVFNRLAMNE